MAYRDALETRRAHVQRLEAQLASLDADIDACVAASARGSWIERLLGGPRQLETRFELDIEVGERELGTACDEVFGVNGRLRSEGGELVWKAEPEPRPRHVEVRLRREHGRARVLVRDPGSYRAYLAALASLGFVLAMLTLDVAWLRVGLACVIVAMGAAVRSGAARAVRRRALEARRLETALRLERPGALVRVESGFEDEAQDAVEASPRRAAR